ncbi:MAG: FtsX-like permease family protein [Acidobacteria bacterium]|nr:FtsX-like permease family protein [Acidobacteriota bacterium]
MRRALAHYWRTNVAVGLAVAVCGAVLTGALLVGDSVRGSLRDLTLDRLGALDVAVVGERFFRRDLPTELLEQPDMGAAFDSAAGAILLRGNAVHGSTRARASQINVIGLDDDSRSMLADTEASDVFRREAETAPASVQKDLNSPFPPITLNAALADTLGATLGDQVLLRFQIGAEVPRDTLLGERETDEVVGTVRGVVESIIPNRGVGRFDLSPHQAFPLNAYLDMERLQAGLDQAGRINAVFLSGALEVSDAAWEDLANALTLEDVGLRLRPDPAGFVEVSSDEFVLRSALVEATERAAGNLGVPTLPLQAYLANAMRRGAEVVPYSMVLASDAPTTPTLGRLVDVDGEPAGTLADDEILINAWTAEQLGAAAGDQLEMDYFVVGIDERLRNETSSFRIAGVLAMDGLAADPQATPEYPGIEGVDNIADWDPPFPVDLSAVRDVDEVHWDDYRGAPKAVVSSATGARLWATRYGATTAIRVAVPEGIEAAAFATQLGSEIEAAISPAQLGYRFLDAKARGLEGATGATDFAGLFIAFSFFIIFAALLIVAMLFNLGVDARAREVGTLLALGFPARVVRNRLLAESAVVAACGAALGAVAGITYARAMLWALTTWWLPAVGSPLLFLHVQPGTLAIGFLLTVVIALGTIFIALRRLRALPPTRLLVGDTRPQQTVRHGPGRSRWLAPAGFAIGIGTVGAAVATGNAANPGLAFGAGAALLVGGLAAFAYWNNRPRARVEVARGATWRMALRSAGWNPGRSLISVALVASACFVITTVASNTRDPRNEDGVVEEGAGGYRLLAYTDVPLHHNLNTAEGRFDLGFSDDASDALEGVRIHQFRTVPGDDTSCLNLYQPQRPRLLGAPQAMLDEGGFHFASSLAADYGAESPWELLAQDLGPDVVPVIGDANSMQWILKLTLGNELVITDERGRPLRIRLVGTVSESIFQSELLMSEAHLLRHFPSRSGFSFFLVDAPAGSEEELATLLESSLERFGFDAISSAQRIADFLIVQNTYLSTFQALGGLGLLLGTFGLGVVLLRNVIERRGELATLRAVGFPRGALARMVLAENVVMLIAGILIGVGAALAAAAPRVVLGGLALPWTSLLWSVVAILGVGMAASLGAVSLTSRIPLLPALKGES